MSTDSEAASTLHEPIAETIDIDQFLRVDVRVGQVLDAERIPKSAKLLKLSVDLGEGHARQVLAGIAQYYEPEQLIQRKILVVANLAPRTMMGLQSQGMIMAASVGEDGHPVLPLVPEDVPVGSRLH